MLNVGRIQLILSSSTMFNQTVKVAGLKVGDFVKTQVRIMKGEGYIAFSKNVPYQVIKKWQDVLDDIKRSGEYNRLAKLFRMP